MATPVMLSAQNCAEHSLSTIFTKGTQVYFTLTFIGLHCVPGSSVVIDRGF